MISRISIDGQLVASTVRAFARAAYDLLGATLPEPTPGGLPETRRFDAALRAWSDSCGKLARMGALRLGEAETNVRAATGELVEIDAQHAQGLKTLIAELPESPRVL